MPANRLAPCGWRPAALLTRTPKCGRSSHPTEWREHDIQDPGPSAASHERWSEAGSISPRTNPSRWMTSVVQKNDRSARAARSSKSPTKPRRAMVNGQGRILVPPCSIRGRASENSGNALASVRHGCLLASAGGPKPTSFERGCWGVSRSHHLCPAPWRVGLATAGVGDPTPRWSSHLWR